MVLRSAKMYPMNKGIPFMNLPSVRGYGIPAYLCYNALTVGMVGFLVLTANLISDNLESH